MQCVCVCLTLATHIKAGGTANRREDEPMSIAEVVLFLVKNPMLNTG